MKKIKLFCALLLVSSSVFSENSNTWLKVVINNQLSQDIRAEFVSISYDKSTWNGKCADIVYMTNRKQLCSQSPELVEGIPVNLPMTHEDPNFHSEISFRDNQSGLWWYLQPFSGHVLIKTLDGMPIAEISYSLKGHDAIQLNQYTHHIQAELGKFAMWDPVEVISHNAKVAVRKIDISHGLCDASPVITLSTSSYL